MSVPALLVLTSPSSDETREADRLVRRLQGYNPANLMHEEYYDGTFRAEQFGFSIPPNMQHLDAVAGWGGTVVDVLEERLDWLGWRGVNDDTLGLSQVFSDNLLGVESGMGHLDSLIYGTSFVAVGRGASGEPSPLVTVQSPLTTTAEWDRRTRRVSQAIAVVVEGGKIVRVTRYTAAETTIFDLDESGVYSVVERDQHNLGRVPVVQVANRMRASDTSGRSEITAAVRYYTDSAVRTLTGMEVHREFYQAPQRWAMNVDPSKFVGADGKKVSPWQSVQGRVWAVPPNEDGEPAPTVGQFTPASPTPYIEQVKNLATLLAAEAGMPTSYLGYASDNPASADAIRAGEARLVKRAERRQTVFGQAWLEVGRLALLVRDGAVPDEFSDVSVRWRDASTPTRAASADEAVKLIGASVLTSDSTVTYDRIGLSPEEQRQLTIDKRRSSGASVIDALVAQAPPEAPDVRAFDGGGA